MEWSKSSFPLWCRLHSNLSHMTAITIDPCNRNILYICWAVYMISHHGTCGKQQYCYSVRTFYNVTSYIGHMHVIKFNIGFIIPCIFTLQLKSSISINWDYHCNVKVNSVFIAQKLSFKYNVLANSKWHILQALSKF